jgi:hypothetical protein
VSFPEEIWAGIVASPEGQIDPTLLEEFVGYGPSLSAYQACLILQQGVRYGQISGFYVDFLNLIIPSLLCDGDQGRFRAALDEASAELTRREEEYQAGAAP